MNVRTLLRQMVDKGGSDLFLYVGSPPVVRLDGELVDLVDTKLTPVMMKQALYDVLKSSQRDKLESDLKLDYAYGLPGVSRFRVSLSLHRGAIAAQFRMIPSKLPTLDDIAALPVMRKLCNAEGGLIVISGPAGCGKTTTMAAIINEINENRSCTINTIEDPIEFLHSHKKGIVGQQEVGMDTRSFHEAMAQLHRQHPDVLMLGTVPDGDIMTDAIIMAETGELVLLPIRARGAIDTIRRMLDFYPTERRAQFAQQIAMTLTAVISQILVPKADGSGLIAAYEVLLYTSEVRERIHSDRLDEIFSIMTTEQDGMCTIEQSLRKMHDQGVVDYAVASQKAWPSPN